MNEQQLAINLLRELNIVALVRTGPHKYRFSGLVPEFYKHLFPPDTPAGICHEPWRHSHMLAFFMEEAEDFFAKKLPGKLESGLWLETANDGGEVPLTAFARYIDNTAVITIHCVREYYDEKVGVLRQARNELLKMDRMHNDLAVYKKKTLYDPLTSLYNRSAFNDFLEVNLTNRRNAKRSFLSLLMIDIDFFKQINDIHGHLAGDRVLTGLGDILRKSLRSKDIAARYGGEEFVVLTPQTDLDQAVVVAEKLRNNVQMHDFGLDRPLTVSIGLTVYQHGESAQRLLKRADDALYQAKHGGRNRVCSL